MKEYVIYEIYFLEDKNKNENIVITKIILREIYIIDNLVINILIGNDILISKKIDLLFSK